MQKNILAAGAISAMTLCILLADERSFARALVRWQQRPCLISALHLATSGVFLAEGIGSLG